MAWRSVALAQAVAIVEDSLDAAWRELLVEFEVQPATPEETVLAWAVVEDPAAHDWRIVDAAMIRLNCPTCGSPLATGPTTCERCELFHGMRFGARETDRPRVPPGNEHAVRVASAVVRTRHRYSPRARVGYELTLPDLLAGALPTTSQAQAAKALINKLTPDECDRVVDFAQVERLAGSR